MINFKVGKSYKNTLEGNRWYLFKGEINGLFIFIDEEDDYYVVLKPVEGATSAMCLCDDPKIEFKFEEETPFTVGSKHTVDFFGGIQELVCHGITPAGLLILKWEGHCYFILDTNKIDDIYDPKGVTDVEQLVKFRFIK